MAIGGLNKENVGEGTPGSEVKTRDNKEMTDRISSTSRFQITYLVKNKSVIKFDNISSHKVKTK